MVQGRAVEGWEVGVREPEWVMRDDMQRSVFCLCPPGHSQWTTRLAKAILAGCIPVTFFRDHDNPWQDALDYSLFSINVDPDDIPSLVERLDAVLRNPRRLLRLQRNVHRVQAHFSWDASLEGSVQALVVQRLWCRARSLRRTHAHLTS
ncbi:hypothetical protein CLOM_g10571 [Closterium sp. NIES-68]|nr:hypothetical protein CLOM_g10571 [Closterium sp. NIES-68]